MAQFRTPQQSSAESEKLRVYALKAVAGGLDASKLHLLESESMKRRQTPKERLRRKLVLQERMRRQYPRDLNNAIRHVETVRNLTGK